MLPSFKRPVLLSPGIEDRLQFLVKVVFDPAVHGPDCWTIRQVNGTGWIVLVEPFQQEWPSNHNHARPSFWRNARDDMMGLTYRKVPQPPPPTYALSNVDSIQ